MLVQEHDVVHAIAYITRIAVKPHDRIVAPAGNEPTMQLRAIVCGKVHILEVHAEVVGSVGYLSRGEECQESVEQVILPSCNGGCNTCEQDASQK